MTTELTCEDVGCQCMNNRPPELDFMPNLNVEDARLKLIAAEMTLANIRALCNAFEHPTAAQVSGLLDAVYEVANRTMDTHARKAIEVLSQINSFKYKCRDLGKALLEFAGPEEQEDEAVPKQGNTNE